MACNRPYYIILMFAHFAHHLLFFAYLNLLSLTFVLLKGLNYFRYELLRNIRIYTSTFVLRVEHLYCNIFYYLNLRLLLNDSNTPCPCNRTQITYLLTPWSRVFLEKILCPQIVKKFSAIMEPEGSLPHSHVPVTCPYPEPALPIPCPHTSIPEDPSKYYPPIYALVFQVFYFSHIFPPKPCICLSSSPHVLHATPILLPEQYWVRSTDH